MAEKRTRGRPKADDPRDAKLEIRLTRAELERFAVAANRSGKPISVWARDILNAAS